MAASSSSSSEVIPRGKYYICLSFKGEDTSNTFVSHLEAALRRKNLVTFIDDKLNSGDEIAQSLLDTTKASKISIVVFSTRYANSRWCLRELEQILECKETSGQVVIPVFYQIDPSHVRNQTETFGDAFAELEKSFEEQLEMRKRWKTAFDGRSQSLWLSL